MPWLPVQYGPRIGEFPNHKSVCPPDGQVCLRPLAWALSEKWNKPDENRGFSWLAVLPYPHGVRKSPDTVARVSPGVRYHAI